MTNQMTHAEAVSVIAEKQDEIETLHRQLAEAKAPTAHESDCCEACKAESALLREMLAEEKAGWAAANMHALTFGLERDEATIRIQQLEAENETLRQQLAESQAREAKLRTLVPAFRPSYGAVGTRDIDVARLITAYDAVMDLKTDDTTLRQIITKAGEVMRKRAIEECRRGYVSSHEIRDLPVVTLEDLQK